MTPLVVVLLLLAGLSEAAGRVLPLVVRGPKLSRPSVIGLLAAGAVVEGIVFALWPLTAWTLAELVTSPTGSELTWTPGLVAPLIFTAVLAFPLLGPFLHLLLFIGVGFGLADALATDWTTAAACVAVAGVGLGAAVEVVRRLVVRVTVPTTLEPVT
ncbi:hypothetical protein [Kribbella sp. NPDC051770]|uniref:hypothetical protein n=1 Tax=Kribbella sp. NPDC051770 TaxID=3155413 RepID=UPI0034199790